MPFVIATPERLAGDRRLSSFDDASTVPEPGTSVVVSLPETGDHAIGRVDRVDRVERIIYLAVDEASRVWS